MSDLNPTVGVQPDQGNGNSGNEHTSQELQAADSERTPAEGATTPARGAITSKRIVIPADARKRVPRIARPEQPKLTPTEQPPAEAEQPVQVEPEAATPTAIAPESADTNLVGTQEPEVATPTFVGAEPETNLAPSSLAESSVSTETGLAAPEAELSTELLHICPFLGLVSDPKSRFAEPSPSHRCYSPRRPGLVDVAYQGQFCFSDKFATCERFSAEDVKQVTLPAPMPMAEAPVLEEAVLPTVLAEPTPAPARKTNRRGVVEIVLWVAALALAVVAIVAIYPVFFPNGLPFLSQNTVDNAPTLEATSVVIAPATTATPETSTGTPTVFATVPILPTLQPLAIPTAPEGGISLDQLPLGTLTGYYITTEERPHWGADHLIAASSQGQKTESVLQFDLSNLPADSQVVYAALELTAASGDDGAHNQQFQVQIVDPGTPDGWIVGNSTDAQAVQSLGSAGPAIAGNTVNGGQVNTVVFDDQGRQLLAQQFKSGRAVLRIAAPQSDQDYSATWFANGTLNSLNAPQLHLVVIPGTYAIVTNTPVPTNVLTAAANVVRGTQEAIRNGTPTPFPPGVATATPGGERIGIDSGTAIPDNRETEIARAMLATAVAVTTGTYTPTPPGVFIIFPTNTPVVINPANLTTATPIPPDADLLSIPIDYQACQCQGMIIALTTRFGGSDVSQIVLQPDGTVLGKLSGDLYYKLALAREIYSPDRTKRVIYPKDSKGIQQIGYEDLNTGDIKYLTKFTKGISYDAVWAPDGSAIAFVSTNEGNADQIYVYDFGTDQVTLLVKTPGGQPWFKHPTWSPDSQQIAYWSSVSGHPQVWVMNRDGTNQVNISDNNFVETDPVWVK